MNIKIIENYADKVNRRLKPKILVGIDSGCNIVSILLGMEAFLRGGFQSLDFFRGKPA